MTTKETACDFATRDRCIGAFIAERKLTGEWPTEDCEHHTGALAHAKWAQSRVRPTSRRGA